MVDILQIFSGVSKINDPKNWQKHCAASNKTLDIMRTVIFKNTVKILNLTSEIDRDVLFEQIKNTIQSNQQIAKTFIEMNKIGLAEARGAVMGSVDSLLYSFKNHGFKFIDDLVKREDLAAPHTSS